MTKTLLRGMTVGEIRQRADKWFEWDEVHLLLGKHEYPLELGFSDDEDDWTNVESFQLYLDQLDDDEMLKLSCDGKQVVVVSINDQGEPFLIVEAI